MLAWLDRGDAADLVIDPDVSAARAAIAPMADRIDFVVQPRDARVPVRLFVADMDSTMIGQECIDELADYAGKKAEVAEVTERAMNGELGFREALAERVALLGGLRVSTVTECLKHRIRARPGARTLVATLGAEGVFTQLVTGGFTAFADPLAEQIGFDAVAANRLSVEDGRLIGTTEGPVIDSAAKRKLLERRRTELGIAAAAVMAAGDGANDVPMIEAAGIGIGFRPKAVVEDAADGVIQHHDLDALLWAAGIPRARWVV